MKVHGRWNLAMACLFIISLTLMSSFRELNAAESPYPNRPISLVVPVPPGGNTDLGARLIAQFMEKELKQPVVVVNKVGAAGTMGGYAVSSAKPDGYTLGFFTGSTAVPEAYSDFFSAPYTSDDLRPICRAMTAVLGVTVKTDAPWRSLKELVEFARNNPGMKFGHLGKSTTQYIVPTLMARSEKLSLVDVPFDGDGTLVPAILGGHVPWAIAAFAGIKSQVDAKKLRVLAMLIEKRAAFAPDIPTLVELGYELPYVPFMSFYGPKKTPDEVVKTIAEVVRKVTADKEFLDKATNVTLEFNFEDADSVRAKNIRIKETLASLFKKNP